MKKTRVRHVCLIASLGVLVACSAPMIDESQKRLARESTPTEGEMADGGIESGSSLPAPPDATASVDAGGEGGSPPAANECALPGLIACFTFEGTSLEDQSPSKLVPSYVQGLSFGAGKRGQGLDVTPVTNLRFAPSASFSVGSATVEAFIKIPALPASTQVIFDADERFGMAIDPSGAVRCAVNPTPVIGGSVAPGRWVHVACVLSGGQVSIYVDGLLVRQGSGTPSGGSGQEAIAGDAPGGEQRFVGSIDTMRVFNVARSAADVSIDAK